MCSCRLATESSSSSSSTVTLPSGVSVRLRRVGIRRALAKAATRTRGWPKPFAKSCLVSVVRIYSVRHWPAANAQPFYAYAKSVSRRWISTAALFAEWKSRMKRASSDTRFYAVLTVPFVKGHFAEWMIVSENTPVVTRSTTSIISSTCASKE